MNRWSLRAAVVPIAFGSIVGANVVSMSVLNFFEARTDALPIMYISVAAFIALSIARTGVEFPKLSKGEHLFCVFLAGVLFLPRATYLIEDLVGYATHAASHDDLWHIQQVASLVHSASFPARSTFDQGELMRYYYAPWMLGAAIFKAGLTDTVKEAIGIAKLIYLACFSYFLMYSSKVLFDDRSHQKVFLALCILYGGFDFIFWLSQANLGLSHSEWWAFEFGLKVQYSSFITIALWVQHHGISAVCILYAMYLVRAPGGVLNEILGGILLVSSLFSSVFVPVGAVPLLIWFFFRRHRIRAIVVGGTTAALLALPLLWLFLGKDSAVGIELFGELNEFWRDHKRAAFVVFLLVAFLELWPLLVASSIAVRRQPSLKWIYVGILSYLISAFFIAFSGANNYAMRGTMIPIFTLIYLSAPIISEWVRMERMRWVRPMLVLYLLGGVLEYASFSNSSFRAFVSSNRDFFVHALTSNKDSSVLVPMELVKDAYRNPYDWYILEKFKPIRKDPITSGDLESMTSNASYRVTFRRLVEAVR